MKYKLIGKNNYENALETVFINRGIAKDNINNFLFPTEKFENSYKLLKNINRGVECLNKHLQSQNKILIVIDSDCDGFTSSAILYNYLIDSQKLNKNNIEFVVQPKKQHGINHFPINLFEPFSLIIIPDAGSNDYLIHQQLAEKNIDILILDHHITEKESEHAIIINNQLKDAENKYYYPNQTLSGAGVVYKFCQALDYYYNLSSADNYIDLAMWGIVGDVMDIRNLETKYIIDAGLNNIKNPFLIKLIKAQEFSIGGEPTIESIVYYIVPLINALIRMGTIEEKENLFRAFINEDIYFDYKKRGSKETVKQHITVAMSRICKNTKSRQDKLKKKGIEVLKEKIEEKKLNNEKVLIVYNEEDTYKNLTGLMANELMDFYKKPTIILKNYTQNVYGGSARCNIKTQTGDEIKFIKIVQDTKLFSLAEGHENAFGINISHNNLNKLQSKFNKILENVIFENYIMVDFILEADQLNEEFIYQIGELNCWGQNVAKPKIYINNIIMNSSDIMLLGSRKNTIKFQYNNIDFIKFFTNEEYYNELTKYKRINIELIGTCGINIYENRKTPQIQIKKIKFNKKEKEILF